MSKIKVVAGAGIAAGLLAVAVLATLAFAQEARDGVADDDRAEAVEERLHGLDPETQAYVECKETSGLFTARILPGEGLRPPRISYQIPATEGTKDEVLAAARAVEQECRAKHTDFQALAVAKAKWSPPTEAEIDEVIRLLRTCVEEASSSGALDDWPFAEFAISPHFEGKRIEIERAQYLLYAECALDVWAATGIQAPAPIVAGQEDHAAWEGRFD